MEYQGCYGDVKIICFYVLLIEPKVSLKLNFVFIIPASSSEHCVQYYF